jgi:DNA polymerase I-like protein with 3'-5' exonuclease and polymerase domains
VNYLIQGTAADVMKNAMVNVDEMLVSTPWPDVHMLMTIHDELAIEVPWELHSKRLMRDVVLAMQRDSKRLKVPVPLPVGMKIATHRWHKTREVAL